MKLSFSIPSKPKSKSNSGSGSGSRVRLNSDKKDGVDEGNLKEFVTEFDPSETLTHAKPKYVIPPIEDRRRPYKNIDLPLQSGSASGLQFESEVVVPSVSNNNTSYGLNLRQRAESSKTEPVEQLLLKSMRKDLASLPDAPELEDFESFPVDGFGEALLAGYGWKPGQGIGLNAKEDVKIVEYKKWSGNEGFGFTLDYPKVKDTTTKAKAKEIGKSDKSHAAKEVRTITGRETLGSGSQEEVKVGIINVDRYRVVVSKRNREAERESRAEVRACKKNYRGGQTREKASWLTSHIRVRIVSKDLKCGRLYLRKGVVNDVVGQTTCDITMDETQELVQGIDQKLLETALPRRGGRVLVLLGRHKGSFGSLVEKDLDKETGVVCDADSHEMLNVKLEQVAEYMGDPADIGF
ncbi:PREDICTED: protein MOS2-like [Camelina sativa]|uniref:Protein MOS2-like n=1 Tax=Camelina sativa TaxID=90675 RepID=A0ABM0UC14_CAMSA|nr:PREDICTED: protein MOS2-like [Camelina sativa]